MTKRKVAIINDTLDERHHGCAAVMAAIERGCSSAGLEINLRHPVSVDWQSVPESVMRIREADLVVVNGEGSIRDDNHRAVALCAVAAFCRSQGIPAVLVNAGLRGLSSTLGNLAKFNHIYVRDLESQRLAEQAGIRAEWTGDLTFSFDFSEFAPTGAARVPVFTDSVLRWLSTALQQDAALYKTDFLPIRPSVYAPNYLSYVELLARSGFVVTGRFHGMCLCANAEIPFVGMTSNSNKLEALACDIWSNERRVVRPSSLHSVRSRVASLFERITARPTDGRHRKQELDATLQPLMVFSGDELDGLRRYKIRAREAISRMWADIAVLANRGGDR